jgi:transposase-like protein
MTSNKGHHVSTEVKADIIRRIREEGIPVAQAAKEHGLHDSTIYNWLGAGAHGAPTFSEFARIQKQNKDLLEIVGEMTLKLSQAQKKN